jgi:hypothetical protein
MVDVSMQLSSYTASRGVKAGMIGGLVGGVLLGVFALVGSMAMGQEVPYVTMARNMGLGDFAVIGGWTLHFITSLVAGGVFVGVTGLVKSLTLNTIRKSLWIGALAGVAVWIVVDVPVTGVLTPQYLTNTTFAVGTFFLHIVYGIITALVAVVLLRRNLSTTTKT